MVALARTRRCAIAVAAVLTVTATLVMTQLAAAAHQPGQVVATAQGDLTGLSRTTYDAWLGIPYAAPPVGDLRFRAPQPVARWSGVRDATKFGGRCVQGPGLDPGYAQPFLNEDCLYLNVYVPHTDRGEGHPKLPVFVWIHGGGFTGGAGQDTDPRRYIEQSGNVFVTINYRLGALGYLNLPELQAEGAGAGSFGLLDQQAALRWVKQNISRFGGDPDNVTVGGQSAGGSSVCDQLASPTAHGLFQRAVVQSGGCGMSSQAAGQAAGAAFVRAVGCSSAPNVLDCLRGKSTAEILAARSVGPSLGDATSFPTDPAQAVATGSFNRVPVVYGQTENEQSLFTFAFNDFGGNPITPARYASMIQSAYGANADKVLAAYPLSAYSSPSDAWGHLQSDVGTYGRLKTERQLAQWTPMYVYEFSETQTPQFPSIFNLQLVNPVAHSYPFGATHVDELPYLWDEWGQTVPLTDDELELSQQMIELWSAFQATGTPNGSYLPEWPAFDVATQTWMSLDACETPPSGNAPPAACSQAMTFSSLVTKHHLDLWASYLGYQKWGPADRRAPTSSSVDDRRGEAPDTPPHHPHHRRISRSRPCRRDRVGSAW
jgi:para-nitrobenzyl esterase